MRGVMITKSILKVIIPTLVCTSIFFIGCTGGSSIQIKCSENNTKNSMEMKYSKFKGNKFTQIDLKEGEELTLNFDVETKEGELSVLLTDKEGNELFKETNPNESLSKTISINKTGKYKVMVQGNHSGNFKVSWDINKKTDLSNFTDELFKKREELAKKSHVDINKYMDWFVKEEDEISTNDIEKIKEISLDKTKKYNKDKKLSYKEAKEDIDELFKVFKYGYAPYKYFGGNDTFNKAKADIIKGIEGKESIISSEFRDLIVKNLSFINDKNVSIDGALPYKLVESFMLTKHEFYKDDKGVYKFEGGKKCYIKSINGSEELDKYVKPSINNEGRIVYTIVDFIEGIEGEDKIPSEGKKIQIVFKADNEEKKEDLQLDFRKYDKNDSKTIDAAVKDGVTIIKLGQTDSWDDRAYGSKLVETVNTGKDSDIIILDLRGNAGKMPVEFKVWCQELFGTVLDEYRCDGFRINTKLTHSVSGDDEKYFPYVFQKYQGVFNKFVKSNKKFFVLMDKYNYGEMEYLLLCLSPCNNVVLVGENTGGYSFNAEDFVSNFKLINSNMNITLPKSLNIPCYPGKPNGYGVQPDIWVEADKAEDKVMKLIKYYDFKVKK